MVKHDGDFIDLQVFPESVCAIMWNRFVHRKVSNLVLIDLLDCASTKYNLSNQKMDVPSILCLVCSNRTETTNHILGECEVAVEPSRHVAFWLETAFHSSLLPTNLVFWWVRVVLKMKEDGF